MYALYFWSIIIVLSLELFPKHLELRKKSTTSKMASGNSLVGMEMADSNDVTNSCLEYSNSEYFPCSPVPPTSGENVFVGPRSSKRRASPLYKTSLKKSTPVRKSSTTKAKANQSFPDMLFCAFNDSEFQNKFTPMIHSMLTPVIQATIGTTMKTYIEQMQACMIKQVLDSNLKLKESIDDQTRQLKDLRYQLDEKSKEIDDKHIKIEELQENVQTLTEEVNKSVISIKTHDSTINDLEQYGRRHSIRISNMKFNSKAGEEALAANVTSFINEHMLRNAPQVSVTDADRCHPVEPKQILVKFYKLHTKHLLYSAKAKFRNNPDKIFISKVLTRKSHAIVNALQPLIKDGSIHSFWTTNGKVMMKVIEDGKFTRIYHVDDIAAKLK